MAHLRGQMLADFQTYTRTSSADRRQIWPGHPDADTEVGPGYFEPYTLRANLTTEPPWYGLEEFPVHWAVANYLEWRIAISSFPTVPVCCIHANDALPIAKAAYMIGVSISFFRPFTITKSQRTKWERATRKILHASALLFSSPADAKITEDMTSFVGTLLCKMLDACAKPDSRLSAVSFLETHEFTATERTGYVPFAVDCQSRACGLEKRRIKPLLKGTAVEFGLFWAPHLKVKPPPAQLQLSVVSGSSCSSSSQTPVLPKATFARELVSKGHQRYHIFALAHFFMCL